MTWTGGASGRRVRRTRSSTRGSEISCTRHLTDAPSSKGTEIFTHISLQYLALDSNRHVLQIASLVCFGDPPKAAIRWSGGAEDESRGLSVVRILQ